MLERNSEDVQEPGITMWYTNACSIRGKWGELETRVRGADVVAITESWLNKAQSNATLPGFTAYRQDRVDGRQGGGVVVLVKSGLIQWEANLALATPNIQVVGCGIQLGRVPFGVLCVYRAPSTTPDEDRELLLIMQGTLAKFQRFIIIGDFNLPEITWSTGYAPNGSTGEAYLEWIHERAIVQHVSQATRHRGLQRSSVLDLVFTRHLVDESSIQTEEPLRKSDHEVLKLTLEIRRNKVGCALRRRYGRINHAELLNAARNINWYPESVEPSVHDRWDRIKRELMSLTERFAPLETGKTKHRPLWWKPSLDRAIKIRRRSWGKYKRYGTHQAWSAYKQARNKAQKLQREAKYDFEYDLARNVKQNPKRFYAYVQSNARTRESVGVLDMPDGRSAQNDQDKANTLVRFFKSVYRNPTSAQCQEAQSIRGMPTISEISVREADVLRELKSLKKHKSAGPDGIHPAIVQPLAEILAGPVFALFRQSLEQAVLPDDWREATVVALHKSGSKLKADNYRPVSLTSILCKCLERVVRTQICEYLVNHRLITPVQHGFVGRKSCLTNLLVFLDEVTRRLDEGQQVEVCYLDFSKAFDSVNHKMLKLKMLNLGIVGKVAEWITEFLSNRTFSVRVGDHNSESEGVTSGVPQGSVLGPLLFLIFINDLAQDLHNPCFMFADDVKLAGSDLQRDIEIVHQWSVKWDLPLNPSKCRILSTGNNTYELNGLQLATVTEIKDLGVTMTTDFKPSAQCQRAANKARGELFRLRSTISCRQPEIFIPIYKAIVRPHLEYCVQAWSPYYRRDILCLERVQRLATRMIAGQRGKSYEQRLRDLNLFSLERRRARGDLIETFKIVKGLTGLTVDELFTTAHSQITRGHSCKLQRNYARLEIRANFFTQRVVPLWNRLPEEVISCTSVDTFKVALDNCWDTVYPDLAK